MLILFPLFMLINIVIAGIGNERGYIERVSLVILKYEALMNNVNTNILGAYDKNTLINFINKYPVKFNREGKIIGSNFDFSFNGDGLNFDLFTPTNAQYTNFNDFDVDVNGNPKPIAMRYNAQQTLDIFNRLENRFTVPSTKKAVSDYNKYGKNNKGFIEDRDFGIIGKTNEAQILINTQLQSDPNMKNNYFKLWTVIRDEMNTNSGLRSDKTMNMMNDMLNTRNLYNNNHLYPKYNELSDAVAKFKSLPDTDKTAQKLYDNYRDIYDVFSYHKIVSMDAKGAINNPNDLISNRKIFDAGNKIGVTDHKVIRNIFNSIVDNNMIGKSSYTDYDFTAPVDKEVRLFDQNLNINAC